MESARNVHGGEAGHEVDCGEVAVLDISEVHVAQVALLVNDGVEGVKITHLTYYLQLLFVQGVAGQIALRSQRIFHEPGGVKGTNRLLTGDAGRYDLASTGPASHEMRFHQAGDDAQIGIHQQSVDEDRGTAGWGDAEVDQTGSVAGTMALDTNVLHNPRATDQLGHLA